MSSKLLIEGGAQGSNSKELQSRCRAGFRKLLEKCGFQRRMPQLVASGGRATAFRDFSNAHAHARKIDYVALLVDSEQHMADIEQTWSHLKSRDNWDQPDGADDEQVLMMTTCMETWIATDRAALRSHYGAKLRENALPALHDMESRDRHAVQEALQHATRDCTNAYQKGKRSFEVLEKLDPAELREHLPSFVRCERVLNARAVLMTL